MSSLQGHAQRKSWRSPSTSGTGKRWVGRVVLTIVAIVLIALFIYWLFRRQPKPTLQTFLVQAGSFHLDAIMPPMYGRTATQRIKSDLGATEMSGESDKIASFIRRGVDLGERMKDPDDTLMVIVRGYVLAADDGSPAIACSDLQANGESGVRGLVVLDELFERLTSETETPDSFEGTRLVVLDIEPLAALPRMNQYGDQMFQTLIASVAKLSSRHANRLWVVVTRGPLQNVGWNPQPGIPIATETLLDGIAGLADFNDDDEIRLDELCRYASARYSKLARGTGLPSPELMLLRGGVGLVDDVSDANAAWVAQVVKAEEPTKEEESVPAAKPADAPKDANAVTSVRFQSPQTDAELVEAPTTSPVGANAEPAKAPVMPDTFWDVRDRLESVGSDDTLNPIAIAPHLWRKYVQNVLHAEIESMDVSTGGLRSGSLDRALDDVTLIERAADQQAEQGFSIDASDAIVTRMLSLWRRTVQDRAAVAIDDQVRVADELQTAIALGRIRLWQQSLYSRQAIISGVEPFSEDAQFDLSLDEGELLLGRQDGSTVDVMAMRESAQRIRVSIRASDLIVAKRLSDLIDDFNRTQKGEAWNVVRQAHAWLRSPLPNGTQRRLLKESLAEASIDKPDRESIASATGSIVLATGTPDRGTLSQVVSIKNHFDSTMTQSGDWSAIAIDLLDGENFAKQFVASVRVDPSDAETDSVASPILHGVVAVPRERLVSLQAFDSSRNEITDDQIEMDSFTDHVSIRISPDAKQDTRFQITAKPRAVGSQFDDRMIETSWQRGIDVESGGDPTTIQLTVPAGKVGEARLDFSVFRHRDASTTSVPITVDVKALGGDDDPKLAELNRSFDLSIGLPQLDRIRVAVTTMGLTKEKLSGDDNLPGGVWLRTFASRTTDFTFSVFNESGRPCRARVWLLKLEHPFVDEGVIAYWPEVLVGQMRKVRGNVVGSDGRVFDTMLFGNQKLKGPIDLKIDGDQQPTPLAWVEPFDPMADPNKTPPKEPVAEADSSAVDVSHGFALVIRLIDEAGEQLPGQDQVIWLVPKPWYPEEFVDLQSVNYERGKIQVSAKLKPDFDGDRLNDKIPQIEKTPVTLAWTECPQWESFEPASLRPLDRQTQELKFGLPSRGVIEVPVANNRERQTLVQLDVDGWPRAIKRTLDHREGATPGRRERYDNIEFSSATINYGDKVPTQSDDDDAIEATTTVFYPEPDRSVIFRGRAKSLVTRLAADLTTTFYAGNTPPTIELNDARFWTDRIVQTFATTIDDKGKISLATTVNDLDVSWNAAASRPDDQLNLKATLRTRNETKVAVMQVTLDSTPPTIDGLRRDNARIFLKDRITWKITGSDPQRNLAASGLSRIVVGLDKDGDGKPDTKDKSQPFDGEMIRTFNAPDAEGSYRLAVQAWDKAGLASESVVDTFQVYERPKPPAPAVPAITNPASTAPMAPPPTPKPAERGTLAGKIDIGSTLRGKLTLSPVPSKISPADGVLSIGDSRPSFSFSNVPEGEYTLVFEGTVAGAIKSFTWKGLVINKNHSLPAN